MKRVQLLGLCRFSYLGMRGFQVEHATLDERRAYLYDPERLARRWAWFENVALPAWEAQTDPDFTLVIMTGPDLPEPYLSRLHEISQRTPQFKLELVPPMERHRTACAAALKPHVDPTVDAVGYFKHDDDDAVAVDFIATARRDTRFVRPLFNRDGQVATDYMKGLIVRTSGGKFEVLPRHVYSTGIALVTWVKPDNPNSAIDFEHWRMGSYMNVVAMNDKPMFVRVIHQDNDSGALGAHYPWTDALDNPAGLLRKRFRIDMATLKRLAKELEA